MNPNTTNKSAKFLTAGAFAVLVAGVTDSKAAILVSDNFDYPDGSLVPNGGWANHSGNAGDLLVSAGQAVVQHGVPSEDANLPFTPTAGTLYYGFDFSVDSIAMPSFGTDNEYFAHFRSGFDFRARLDIVGPQGGGDYTVGMATSGGSADATWGTDLVFGRVYRAVASYDQVANQAQLWIDASLESDTSIFGADDADPGDAMDSFALRQSDSDNNETVRVDGLVVGTTFDDVVVAVPEPSSAVLLAIAGLGLAVRRRRY